VTPKELRQHFDQKKALLILDVREPFEHEIANLGGILIPLGELPARFTELDPEAHTVVLCHHGIRSAQAVAFLRSKGFTNTHNLAGGIDRWSNEVDPNTPTY
jgi:rhodanese-related sulfurtransferase